MTFSIVQAQWGADLDNLSKNDPAGSAGLTEKLMPNVAELLDSLFIPAGCQIALSEGGNFNQDYTVR